MVGFKERVLVVRYVNLAFPVGRENVSVRTGDRGTAVRLCEVFSPSISVARADGSRCRAPVNKNNSSKIRGDCCVDTLRVSCRSEKSWWHESTRQAPGS